MDAVLEEQHNERIREAESSMEELEEHLTKQVKQTCAEAMKEKSRIIMIKTKARMQAVAEEVLRTLRANLTEYKRVNQI